MVDLKPAEGTGTTVQSSTDLQQGKQLRQIWLIHLLLWSQNNIKYSEKRLEILHPIYDVYTKTTDTFLHPFPIKKKHVNLK